MSKTVQVFYEGRVQGVGFRYSARRVAAGFDVAGYVRNLPDGRVELVASGDPEEVDGFLDALRGSELAGHIAGEVVADIVKPAGLRGLKFVSERETAEGALMQQSMTGATGGEFEKSKMGMHWGIR